MGPVLSTSPFASNTTPDATSATASGFGSASFSPRASRHVPGAQKAVPSSARTQTHGEYLLPGGGITHRPGSQAQRLLRHVHSPSSHTAPSAGFGGTASGRAGGGGNPTTVSASRGWDT